MGKAQRMLEGAKKISSSEDEENKEISKIIVNLQSNDYAMTFNDKALKISINKHNKNKSSSYEIENPVTTMVVLYIQGQ